uniref:Glycosyltransferase family 92 protein n=1 Tax=Caenorhabditis tropicalis TaxID=1561998 RepID=A0A1I7UXW2_9PELO
MKAINDYVRTGEVEIHYLIERDYRADNHWHMVNLADCVIWSRRESKWTIFADLDERIYMTNYTGNILHYVREVKNNTIGSIQFRQQWILKTELMPEKYQGDDQVAFSGDSPRLIRPQIEKWMPTHRWHNSSAIGPPGHTAKCIVDTSKVFIMFIHYVTQFYPGKDGDYLNMRVEPEEGIIRRSGEKLIEGSD